MTPIKKNASPRSTSRSMPCETTEANPSAMSALERANSSLLRYPRFKQLHQVIRQCQSLSKL